MPRTKGQSKKALASRSRKRAQALKGSLDVAAAWSRPAVVMTCRGAVKVCGANGAFPHGVLPRIPQGNEIDNWLIHCGEGADWLIWESFVSQTCRGARARGGNRSERASKLKTEWNNRHLEK